MSHSFIQNCFWITLQVSHHEGGKISVNNGRYKTNFLRRLKQFDLTDHDLPPILRQIYPTVSTVYTRWLENADVCYAVLGGGYDYDSTSIRILFGFNSNAIRPHYNHSALRPTRSWLILSYF